MAAVQTVHDDHVQDEKEKKKATTVLCDVMPASAFTC